MNARELEALAETTYPMQERWSGVAKEVVYQKRLAFKVGFLAGRDATCVKVNK